MAKKNDSSEEAFLQAYDASEFERPSTAVDTVIFTVIDEKLHVLIVKRANHPYRGAWSLVGGYIDIHHDQTLEDTAKRKLQEKTGVKTPYLEQFETIGNQTRDPRGWSITTIYFALISAKTIHLKAGNGATDIRWSPIENGKIPEALAFDHANILSRCVDRFRNKVLYTSLPTYLMPETFTLGELQKVYEVILESPIEHKSFRRRLLGADLLEETGKMKDSGRRPAKLYRLKKTAPPHFFVRTLEAATRTFEE